MDKIIIDALCDILLFIGGFGIGYLLVKMRAERDENKG